MNTTSNTLTSKDEAEYFALREKGLTHEQALKALGTDEQVDRSEWAPEQIEVER
jgi:hypothetical protein